MLLIVHGQHRRRTSKLRVCLHAYIHLLTGLVKPHLRLVLQLWLRLALCNQIVSFQFCVCGTSS